MGFNKRILPSKDKLQSMFYDYGVSSVVEQYNNADVLFGDIESREYFEAIIKEYELER